MFPLSNSLPPNPGLQRTPSAPLSRKSLAATEGICVASREPVRRPSLVVSEGQDMNGVGGFEIDHMVRKAFDRRLADREIFWNGGNWRSGARKPLDLVEGDVYRREEPLSQTGTAFFVPPGGVIELLAGLVLRPERLFHRFVRFASVRRRTSSQAVPLDSPRRTLRARRSISAAHAASRSVLSSGAASRLSSSSAATLARSSGSSFRASSRTSLTSAIHPSLSSRSVAANPALQRTRARALSGRSLLNAKSLGDVGGLG